LRTDRENKDEDIEWIGLALVATWDGCIYMPSRCQYNKINVDANDVWRNIFDNYERKCRNVWFTRATIDNLTSKK
jgi:hypothetical protein